jgi:hypothetical protein
MTEPQQTPPLDNPRRSRSTRAHPPQRPGADLPGFCLIAAPIIWFSRPEPLTLFAGPMGR